MSASPSPFRAYKQNGLLQHRQERFNAQLQRNKQARAAVVNAHRTSHQFGHVVHDIKEGSSIRRRASLRGLARLVLEDNAVMKRFVLENECMELLTELICGTSVEERLDAITCVINIATSRELVSKTFEVAPYLVMHVANEDPDTRYLVIWALANIASTDAAHAQRLVDNGALSAIISRCEVETDDYVKHVLLYALYTCHETLGNHHAGISILDAIVSILDQSQSADVIDDSLWCLCMLMSNCSADTVRHVVAHGLDKALSRIISLGDASKSKRRRVILACRMATVLSAFEDEPVIDASLALQLAHYTAQGMQSSNRVVRSESLRALCNFVQSSLMPVVQLCQQDQLLQAVCNIGCQENLHDQVQAIIFFLRLTLITHELPHIPSDVHNALLSLPLRCDVLEKRKIAVSYLQVICQLYQKTNQIPHLSSTILSALEYCSNSLDDWLRSASTEILQYCGQSPPVP
ncbi:hypothetical protein BZG36_03644 [Bifiguratus adelaidae]|uniref:IBB domain-containing protein n=1 Tax=Bifiguratus adelaidae TaxID=1938954 RepID=A0A261XW66_9FUNG|nr:hypothetical protein BZG36_03644 [Bifiguratus adelaidae]